MSALIPFSPIDRKPSADHEPGRLVWMRSMLLWLVVLAAAGVIAITALSARALGIHAGRHAYPHVLAEPDAMARTADASTTVALLPLHNIEQHFSALAGLANALGMPPAVVLMAGGTALLALVIFLFYRPRRRVAPPHGEISETSRRRRPRAG